MAHIVSEINPAPHSSKIQWCLKAQWTSKCTKPTEVMNKENTLWGVGIYELSLNFRQTQIIRNYQKFKNEPGYAGDSYRMLLENFHKINWSWCRGSLWLGSNGFWRWCIALKASLHPPSVILKWNTDFGDCICSQRQVWATYFVEFQSRYQPLDHARQHSNTQWAAAVLRSSLPELNRKCNQHILNSFY